MNLSARLLGLILVPQAFLMIAASAEESKKPSEERQKTASRLEDREKKPQVVAIYLPRLSGAPTPFTRVTVGGTRGSGQDIAGITLLVPEHVTLTADSQPVFYWYASEPTQNKVVFTLTQLEADSPLLELPLTPPHGAGTHALDLGEHGVHLSPDETYEWSISVQSDPDSYSDDSIARAFLEYRVDKSFADNQRVDGDGLTTAQYHAKNGQWYDAFSTLFEKNAEQYISSRDALLKQVGLPAVGSGRVIAH